MKISILLIFSTLLAACQTKIPDETPKEKNIIISQENT
jgi:hypothetical protein